jgi:CubicO group peptidase (beta-lactamase class C family)
MTAIQKVLDTAVAQQNVPFAVGMVGTSKEVVFEGAAGPAAAGRAADMKTVFRIFSMTKAIGALAAMILIDRGKLSLDTPVADVLPAWSKLKVLDGFDGDTPRLRAPRTQATIRHLATHTSGAEYEFWNAEMPRYMEATGHPSVLSGLNKSLEEAPLMTDPGTRWGYGPSIDWLGKAVEAVTGQNIVDFCQAEIFDPLGMTSTGFEVDGDMADRLAEVKARGEDGTFVPFDLAPPSKPEFYGMGHALYSTAPDYMRFLRMILNKGSLDGKKVLSPDAVQMMTADQMKGLTLTRMKTVAPPVTADFDPFPGTRLVHSVGFMRNEEDIPGKRSAGSQSWAGVLNSHYWIDPARDVAAVIMTQTLPFVEERFMQTYDRFERAVYAGL